jgi:hypothetical protein
MHVITTVIPTYRRPKLLRRAIISVLQQSYPYFRILVCDNASGDETESVVKLLQDLDSRIFYHRHNENIGPYGNFNWGLNHIETDLFSLLSDDDVLMPSFYATAIRDLGDYPDAAISAQNSLVISEHLRILSGKTGPERTTYYPASSALEDVVKVRIPATWTGMVFRRQVVTGIGAIDLNAGPFADGGFVMHAVAKYPIVASPEIGAVLTANPESISASMKPLSKEWPIWYGLMAARIVNDPNIPVDRKGEILRLVTPDFKMNGIFQALRAMSIQEWTFATGAIQGLSECGYPLAAKFLRILGWCWQHIPGFTTAMQGLKRLRSIKNEKRTSQRTVRYGEQVNYFRSLNKKINATIR